MTINYTSLKTTSEKLREIYKSDPKIARSQMKNSVHFLVIGRIDSEFFPLHRIIYGINGKDMKDVLRAAPEKKKDERLLEDAGFYKIYLEHDKFGFFWDRYVIACKEFGTVPSKGRKKRIFWASNQTNGLPVARSPGKFGRADDLYEGAEIQVTANERERNKKAREASFLHYASDEGAISCIACGLEFSATYGKIGHGFIHMHHLDPLAEFKGPRQIDPKIDLVPLCPNCHAMVHREKTALTIEQLVSLLETETK